MASYNSNDLCYLCGEPLGNRRVNEDHVVQKQFIKRKQPKAKGFRYAGTLFTHEDCNSNFGKKPELMCQKALRLLDALYNDKTLYREHKDNPEIRIIAIRSDLLQGFTDYEKKFFKIIDVQNESSENWRLPSYFLGKEKIDHRKLIINVSLSVLVKSAIAFLIRYKKISILSNWRILAKPYRLENEIDDFDDIFGKVEQFEIGVKLWTRAFSNGDRFVAYKINSFIVLFCIGLTANLSNLKITTQLLRDSENLFFESDKLINLIDYDWSSNDFVATLS